MSRRSLILAAWCVVGAVLLAVAAANAGYRACEPGQPGVAGIRADGSTFTSCGGTDPIPFLVCGLAVIAVVVLAALVGARRHQ
jgi:hypothetical protein